MAAIEGKITVAQDLRPCIVNGQHKALFHRWSERSEPVAPSMLKGGHGCGVLKWTTAIVEYEDGRIGEILPADIRFLDNAHRDYSFSERERDAEP